MAFDAFYFVSVFGPFVLFTDPFTPLYLFFATSVSISRALIVILNPVADFRPTALNLSF
jgi:hypothetical protein